MVTKIGSDLNRANGEILGQDPALWDVCVASVFSVDPSHSLFLLHFSGFYSTNNTLKSCLSKWKLAPPVHPSLGSWELRPRLCLPTLVPLTELQSLALVFLRWV
mmetsp:Transcript_716/g.1675  ORF Transcript_716/g.1675 Transcript_716/m.1675 type:complete len:104 (+) Transcript_716:171-482(+)